MSTSAVVVDSRARTAPAESTPANYEIALPRRIDGAVQLRLGDFALGGDDSRLAIDTRRRHIRFCLGVASHANSTVTISGTSHTVYPATSSRVSTVGTSLGFSAGSVTNALFAPYARGIQALLALGYPVHMVQDRDSYGVVTSATLPQTLTYTGTLTSVSSNYVLMVLPYLTVTEMVTVVNRAMSDLGVRARWDADTQEVVWTSPSTLEAIGAPEHSLLWYLGVDSAAGAFPARSAPRCIRTLELPLQTPSSASTLATRLNELWMPTDSDTLTLTVGVTVSTFSYPNSATYPARIVGLFNDSLSSAGYTMSFSFPRFTIARSDGVPFSIEFGDVELARHLGFSEESMLMGASSYSSDSHDIPVAAQGLLSDAIEERQPRRRLVWSNDASGHLHCVVQDSSHFGVLEIDGSDSTPYETAAAANLSGVDVHGLVQGDVFLHQAEVSSVAHEFGMLVTSINALGTTFAFDTRRNGSMTDISSGLAAIIPNRDATLLRLRNLAGEILGGTAGTIPSADLVLTHRGAHWPCNEVVGAPASGSSVALPALMPRAPRLSPPEYVLMVLDEPSGAFRSQSHASTNGRSRVFGVLARVLLTDGLYREAIDANFADLSRVVDLESVRVRFLEPADHSEVDWHGREHSWTLLIKALA